MSRLLENILRNRQKEVLRELDMTKTGTAMMRHLGAGFPYDEETSLPIEAEISSWHQVNFEDKICLQKVYELDSAKFLMYFVSEIISLAEEFYHHPDVLIQHTKVTVTLYTKDLNDVTDRDLEMSKKIDEIIEDINVIKFRG